MFGLGTPPTQHNSFMDIEVNEVQGPVSSDICNIHIRSGAPETKLGNWIGPALKMSLPSFSGKTGYHPDLLKYSCQIECRVRPVEPALVSGPSDDKVKFNERNQPTQDSTENERSLSVSVMLSKPILALQFKSLKMQVEAPVVISPSKAS